MGITKEGAGHGQEVGRDLGVSDWDALWAGVTTLEGYAAMTAEWLKARRPHLPTVAGLATRRTARWLPGELRGTGFRAMTSRVRHASDGEFYGVPVTWRQGVEYSWFGAVQ